MPHIYIGARKLECSRDKATDCWYVDPARGVKYIRSYPCLYKTTVAKGVLGIAPHEGPVLHSCYNPMCVNPDHLFVGKKD